MSANATNWKTAVTQTDQTKLQHMRVMHTMKSHKPGHRSPDSSSPRVSTDSYQQCHKSQSAEANAQLSRVPSAGERYAEMPVLLLTVVSDTHGERSALVVDIFESSIMDHLALTTFHQTIPNGRLDSRDLFRVFYNKPSTQKCVRLRDNAETACCQPVWTFSR